MNGDLPLFFTVISFFVVLMVYVAYIYLFD